MAKIYTKNTWVDEELADEALYNILDSDDTPINEEVKIELVTDVITAGTSMTAEKMNNLENGLDAVDTKLDSLDEKVSNVIDTSTRIEGCKLVWNSATSLSVGTGQCHAENGDFININSLLTASSLSLSNSTWYHVYIYLSSGSPTMEVSTTAPSAWKGSAYKKTGDTSRRYIGSVKTNSSGEIYNFEHNIAQNMMLYKSQYLITSPFRCLAAGTATSATSVSLAGVIPVTGSLAWMRCANNADQVMYAGVATLTSSAFQISLSYGNVSQQAGLIYCPMDASQIIYYMFTGTIGVGSGNIDVYGYVFDR